jgi:hypothetical protein
MTRHLSENVAKGKNPSLNRFGLGRMKTLTQKSEKAAQSP